MPKKRQPKGPDPHEVIARFEADRDLRRRLRPAIEKAEGRAAPMILVGGRPAPKLRQLMASRLQGLRKARALYLAVRDTPLEEIAALYATRRGAKRKLDASLRAVYDYTQKYEAEGARRIWKGLNDAGVKVSLNTVRVRLKELVALRLYQPKKSLGQPPKITRSRP